MFLSGCITVGAMSTQDSDIIQRVNYGVVFKEEARLFLAKESWLHTFEVSIPSNIKLPNIHLCEYTTNACNAYNGIVNFINHLQQSTELHAQEFVNVVQTLVPQPS